MENKFAVHYQTWKNEKATEFTIQKFREFFPTTKMRVVSDNGSDYSHFVEKYGIDFTFSDIRKFRVFSHYLKKSYNLRRTLE